MKAYAYLRVSSLGQVEGDGFTRQSFKVKEYADANGIEVAEWFHEEGVSGKTDLENRPELSRLLQKIIAGSDVRLVLIEKLDRLARYQLYQETILEDFNKRGVTLVSVMEPDLCTDDPTRTLVRQIMGAIAQYDRTIICNRMRGARERIRATGKRCEGRKPYGHTPAEKEIVNMIMAQHSHGKTSVEICDLFNQSSYRPRGGGQWFPQQIRRIILRATKVDSNLNTQGETPCAMNKLQTMTTI